MEKIEKPKIEKKEIGKPKEEGWEVGPGKKHGSLSDIPKEEFGEPEKIEKGEPPEKREKRKRKFWEAELGKTPEELQEESQEELQKARGEVKRLYPRGESKKEEPDKEGARKKELIKETVEAKIPEKYKKYIGDLIGRNDENALRKIDAIPVLKYQAMAFAGTASPESRQFVEDNIENRAAWPWLHFALMGDNTSKGWELRNKLELDKKFDKEGTLKSEKVRGGKWWNLIEKSGLHKSKHFEKLVDNVNSSAPWPGWFLAPHRILESTIGIRLDESSEKVALLEKYGKSAPRAALESLRGDNSSQAKERADKIYGKDETHQGDPRLRDVYDAYQKSIEKLPSHEKS